MESKVPIEQRFKVLCEITRAQHFAWREAVVAMAPQLDVQELINKMWELTGIQTAQAYVKRLDPAKPVAMQLAKSIAWSSVCMGEDATVEEGEGNEALVRHVDCPWFHWHKRLGLLQEDQPGCDMWFASMAGEINRTLGTKIRVETRCSLPEGGDCCLRRIWEDDSVESSD